VLRWIYQITSPERNRSLLFWSCLCGLCAPTRGGLNGMPGDQTIWNGVMRVSRCPACLDTGNAYTRTVK
jgi:hypothetical protein